MINVGIVGGTGYTGVEFCGRLRSIRMPACVPFLRAPRPVLLSRTIFPACVDSSTSSSCADDADLGSCDVVFYATPNGMPWKGFVCCWTTALRSSTCLLTSH